jgi:hypothetical protein
MLETAAQHCYLCSCQDMACSTNESLCDLITIPAVYITKSSWIDIQKQANNLTDSFRAFLNATGEDDPGPKPPDPHVTFFLLVLLIIPIAWCIMVGITLAFKICARFTSRYLRQREVRQLPDIPYMRIEDKPDVKADEKADAKDVEKGRKRTPGQPINETCVICLEDFEAGSQIKVLPCNHGFHGDCIDPWLNERSDKCPICKRSVYDQATTEWVCGCFPLACCQRCFNRERMSPRVTQIIMLVVVAFLAVIIALFFVFPG